MSFPAPWQSLFYGVLTCVSVSAVVQEEEEEEGGDVETPRKGGEPEEEEEEGKVLFDVRQEKQP